MSLTTEMVFSLRAAIRHFGGEVLEEGYTLLMKSLALKSFRLRNKAVRDSGVVRFTPLTVFIGNNGSGKSSLIEGLAAFRAVSEDHLEEVFDGWHGYKNIWHKGQPPILVSVGRKGDQREQFDNPIGFEIKGWWVYQESTVRAGDPPFSAAC